MMGSGVYESIRVKDVDEDDHFDRLFDKRVSDIHIKGSNGMIDAVTGDKELQIMEGLYGRVSERAHFLCGHLRRQCHARRRTVRQGGMYGRYLVHAGEIVT